MREELPLVLNWRQYGIVAAMIFLLASLPVFFSLRQPEHIILLELGPVPTGMKIKEMSVAIFPSGEIQVDQKPVSLIQLSDLAKAATVQNRSIVVDPDQCALHNIVTMAIAALKRTGNPAIRLAKPRYPVIFGKAHRTGAELTNLSQSFASRLHDYGNRAANPALATVVMSPVECGGTANPQPRRPTKPAR